MGAVRMWPRKLGASHRVHGAFREQRPKIETVRHTGIGHAVQADRMQLLGHPGAFRAVAKLRRGQGFEQHRIAHRCWCGCDRQVLTLVADGASGERRSPGVGLGLHCDNSPAPGSWRSQQSTILWGTCARSHQTQSRESHRHSLSGLQSVAARLVACDCRPEPTQAVENPQAPPNRWLGRAAVRAGPRPRPTTDRVLCPCWHEARPCNIKHM